MKHNLVKVLALIVGIAILAACAPAAQAPAAEAPAAQAPAAAEPAQKELYIYGSAMGNLE
jgi:uncharacterized lipoprotein YajG